MDKHAFIEKWETVEIPVSLSDTRRILAQMYDDALTSQPAGEPGWLIPMSAVNEPQKESLERLEDALIGCDEVDIIVRKDGANIMFEADYLRDLEWKEPDQQ